MPANALAFVARAMRLGGVLDNTEPAGARERENRIEIRGLPIKMHRQDHFGAWRERGLDALRIDVAGALVGLDWNRCCAALADREPSRDISVRGNDRLVAGSDPERAEGEMQGV